ncbi:hypothetical protein PSAC2689_40311 [Paraburkholderia sacchari]
MFMGHCGVCSQITFQDSLFRPGDHPLLDFAHGPRGDEIYRCFVVAGFAALTNEGGNSPLHLRGKMDGRIFA